MASTFAFSKVIAQYSGLFKVKQGNTESKSGIIVSGNAGVHSPTQQILRYCLALQQKGIGWLTTKPTAWRGR
jgi:hypothetical protein